MCNVLHEGPGSQAIQDDEECVNSRGDQWCKGEIFNQGGAEYYCTTEYRKNQCQKSCGVCKSNKCENAYRDNDCVNYVLGSEYPCMDYDQLQQKHCAKTCNLCSDYCEDVSSGSCSDYYIKQTPYGCNNPKMMIQCKKSCGYCPTAKVCPNEISDDYCKSYKYSCEYDEYIKKNCKKTCGLTDCWKSLS